MSFLHIASGQNLQNLIPLLALNPQSVIQLCSRDQKIEDSAKSLRKTLREYYNWQESLIQNYILKSKFPLFEEVIYSLEEIHNQEKIELINITGGTKIISIAAYEFAKSHGIPTFYVDTNFGDWIDGKTGSFPADYFKLTFKEAVNKLTVPVILSANGLTPEKYQDERIDRKLLEFGRRVTELRREDIEGHIAKYIKEARDRIHGKNKNLLEKGRLREKLNMGLPTPTEEIIVQFLNAAVEVGIVHVRAEKYYLNPAPEPMGGISNSRLTHAVRPNWRLLEGSWWELGVIDKMMCSNKYLDIRWSVQCAGNDDAGIGETDIIAIDRRKLNLITISCKASEENLKKPLEHVSSTRQRAIKLGGSFAEAQFFFFKIVSPNKNTYKTIHSASKAIGCKCLYSVEELDEVLSNP